MNLSDYILNNMEELLQEREYAAQKIVPGLKGTKKVLLRDHAEQMLRFVADDIQTDQTKEQKDKKSMGLLKAISENPWGC